MKTPLRSLFFYLQHLLKRNERFIRTIPPDSVSVLTFHNVEPDSFPGYLSIDPADFEDLTCFLQRHFTITTFRGVAGADANRPKVILSFDDGYYDFVETVMPILHKHGIRANLNVCVGNLDGKMCWYEPRLRNVFRSAPSGVLNDIRIPGFPRQVFSDDLYLREKLFLQLNDYILVNPAKTRAELWACIERATRNVVIPPLAIRMMSASDVVQAASTHEIGMHSVDHQSMVHETDEYFENDLAACLSYFQETLRLPADIYAFPYGHYRRRHIDILKNRGVQHILLANANDVERGQGLYPSRCIHGSSRYELRLRALRRPPSLRNPLTWLDRNW